MPRKDQLSKARHLEARAGDPSGLKCVDLLEQRWQIDDNTIADDRNDVLVQHSARDQLKRIFLVTNDDRVSGIVSTLIANDVVVRLGQEVNDFGFALITPLRTYDDCDGHQTLLLFVGNVRRV